MVACSLPRPVKRPPRPFLPELVADVFLDLRFDPRPAEALCLGPRPGQISVRIGGKGISLFN
jgi:hypothetical protein